MSNTLVYAVKQCISAFLIFIVIFVYVISRYNYMSWHISLHCGSTTHHTWFLDRKIHQLVLKNSHYTTYFKIIVHTSFDIFIRVCDCSTRVYQSVCKSFIWYAFQLTACSYKLRWGQSRTFWTTLAVTSRNDDKIYNLCYFLKSNLKFLS